jgi:hypothetical protein
MGGRYIYRVSRTSLSGRAGPAPKPKAAPEPEEEEVSYRDLQAQAKDLGIPANQSADDLKKAIEEAESG